MATAKKGPGTERRGGSAHDADARSMVEPEVLARIVSIVSEAGFSFLDWRRGDERLVLRRDAELVSHPIAQSLGRVPPSEPVGPSLTGHRAPEPGPAVNAEAARPQPTGTVVTSPFVGTFYRAPSPDAQVFVEAGQVVRKGQVLCIIEAMKLMNEIEAELAGKVTEVIAQNGQTVEFGQPLFRIEPS